jgi:hypothetical protein
MRRFCPPCLSNDGIDASHNQACTAIAELARFECDLLHIADFFVATPFTFSGTGGPTRTRSLIGTVSNQEIADGGYCIIDE